MAERVVGLDHVQVAAPAGCEPEARRFYGGLLGLEEIAKPEPLAGAEGAWFACGRHELHVGVTEEFTAAQKAHPALRVADVTALDALAERLRAAGAPVEPDERLPGHRRFYTQDPWGNRVELLAPTRLVNVRIDHVVIAVSDWERSNVFYREVLGAEVIELGPDRYAYALGGQRLNVHGPGTDAGDLVARDRVRPGNSDLCFEWPSTAEDAVEHLRRCGIEIEAGPVERSGAGGPGTSVYFRDPDGSLLELISYSRR